MLKSITHHVHLRKFYLVLLAACSISIFFCRSEGIAAPGDIHTVAGGSVGDGNSALSAFFNNPSGVSVSSSGDIFIADTRNNRIRKVDRASGLISTVVGTGEGGYSGDGGPATAARLNQPNGLHLDAAGNLFIADSSNHCIRKVDATTGIISTIAGNGTAGYWGDGGAANQAGLNSPLGVFVDVPGNVYIADSGNARIRKIDLSGVISTVAGSGVFGFLGDGGAATAITARLANPQGVVVDAAGQIFIADSQNHRIRKVSTSGILSTVAGNGTAGFSGDGGDALAASINYPRGVTIDAAGTIYIADYSNHRIRRVASGLITTFAGNGSVGNCLDGVAPTDGSVYWPMGIAFDSAGNFYIAENGSQRVRKIDVAANLISTIAGSGSISGYTGDGGPATAASLYYPESITLDAMGNIFIADRGNSRIRKVNKQTGIISTVVGEGSSGFSGDGGTALAARLNWPSATAVHSSGDIYLVDTYNQRIRKVDAATGIISTVAGNGIAAYTGDGGLATAASLNYPSDVAVDGARNIYVADRYNNVIRKVDGETGVITTVAGNGSAAFSGDGGQATASSLNQPAGLFLDSTGNIFIADTINYRVRKVDSATGVITTVAGNGMFGSYQDGYLATETLLPYITGVAVDASGNIFIADDTSRIGKVHRVTGIITTVAGTLPTGFFGDGGPAIAANLYFPHSVALDTAGNVYIADTSNQRIRMVEGQASDTIPPVTVASLPAGTYTGTQSVTLTCSDSGSGCAYTYYCLGSGCSPTNPNAGTITIPYSTDLRFFSMDIDGNSEVVQTVTYSIEGDMTPPVTTANPGPGTYSSPQNVILQANEPATIFYTTDGSDPVLSPTRLIYGGSIAISATTILKFYAVDPAGNGEAVQTATYTICAGGTCPDVIVSGGQIESASINSLGEIVWSQFDPASGYNQIYASARGQLTNDAVNHYSPVINNMGDMVWREQNCGYDMYSNWTCTDVIRGMVGGMPFSRGSSQFGFGKIDLNDRGEVIWTEQDGTGVSQVYSNVRGRLTSDSLNHREPSINNAGDVVYVTTDPVTPAPSQIGKLSAGSTVPTAVTNDDKEHRSPSINDSGEMVWTELGTSGVAIVSSIRGALLPVNALSIDQNNCGDLVYVVYEPGQNKLYRFGTNAPCVTHPGANDSQSQASPVTFGDIYTGLMDSATNPVDWYRFDATSGDNIHIKVTYDNNPSNAINIGLYDGNGNLLSGPTATNPLGIDTKAGFSGSYYLKVEAQGGRFGYVVSLSKYTNNCGVGPCPELIAGGGQIESASINSLGEIVWSQFDQATSYNQIYSSARGQLTSDAVNHYSPAINNMGDMVWREQSCGYDMYSNWTCTDVIRGNVGGIPFTRGSGQFGFGKIDLNDRGEVIWSEQDGTGVSQIYSSVRGRLTSDALNHREPSINNVGEVVYVTTDPVNPVPAQIAKLPAGSTVPIAVTNDDKEHRSPSINDSGEIVWTEMGPSGVAIVSSIRGTLLPVNAQSIDQNNCGDLVSVVYEPGQNKLYRYGTNAPCVTHPGANDTQAQASPVTFGDIYTGVMDSAANPVDWYRFDATSGDNIHIKVTYDNKLPNSMKIGLYDGNGNLLSGPTSTNPLGIYTTAGLTGTYYLKVEAQGGRYGYVVSLSKYSNNCGVGPCREELTAGQIDSATINALGEIVWSQYDQATGYYQIYSSRRGPLTSDAFSHTSPVINNFGDVVWFEQNCGYDMYSNWSCTNSIKGTIGGTPITTAINFNGGRIGLNDRGEIVWSQQDSMGVFQVYSNVRGQLTSDAINHYGPAINNQGDIIYQTWDQMNPGPFQLSKLLAGSTIPVVITSDGKEHRSPVITDSGEIIWSEANPSGVAIVSSIRGVLVNADAYSIDQNNCGDLVYITSENGLNKMYRLGSSSPCVTHPDSNDTQTQASPVTFGDIFTGAMDSATNPVDWYRFDANGGDSIHIKGNFDNHPPNMLSIGLYDSQGNLISGPVTANPLGIYTTTGLTGTYYLKVESPSGRFGYTVSLSKYSNNCGVGPCPEIIAMGQLGGTSINSLGEVVWSQYDPGTNYNQIYSSTRGQLTNDAVNHYAPATNNLGDLIWVEQSCYDIWNCTNTLRGIVGGASMIIATTQNWLGNSDLNDRGEVIWLQRDPMNDIQVHSNLRGQLTTGTGYRSDASINNHGDVVFVLDGIMTPGSPVFKLSAGSTTPVALTADSYQRRSVDVNDSGEVVWSQRGLSTTSGFSVTSSVRGMLVPAINDVIGVDMNNCGDIIYVTNENGQNKLTRLGRSAPCSAVPERSFALAVSKALSGTANGQVSSTPAGIDLPAAGTTTTVPFAANATITLTATPDATSVFTGWFGACSGTGECQVTMDMAKSVTARFDLKPSDTIPPVTSATPDGGIYNATQTVTLTCSDGAGSGCAATYYCLGTGCNPTIPYSGGITINSSIDLSFYSTDTAGNSETWKTVSYVINNLVKVDGSVPTFFDTIQAACDGTATDNIIKLRASLFNEHIVFNRQRTLTLKGGYDQSYGVATGFTTITGSLTITDGTIVLDGIVIQ